MTQHLMNNVPDYIDDRIKMTVILSDDVQYQLRALAPSNKVSSWYNPDERRAYSTVDIDEVPENFRSSLI